MAKQLTVSGKKLVRILTKEGFTVIRINGSHHRLKHYDDRVTTVPVHKNDDLPKGLIQKIVREDLRMELEDFNKLLSK
jgi:predicted RNA binding protein YcfA (HicA-like mRNA interferase family)